MTWKLLALDLDDTLLGPDREADEAAERAVRMARRAGILPVVATGRPYASAEIFARRLDTRAPVIANNGAVVRGADGSPLRELHLDRDAWLEAVDLARREGWVVYLYTPGGIYSNRAHPDTRRYARILEVPIQICERMVEEVSAAGQNVTAVGLRTKPDAGEEVEHHCRQLFGERALIVRSVPTLIEILPGRADKGSALAFLCAHLDIPLAASAAVGDGIGDIDMLEVAGCGVLVCNADTELHPLADWVTDHPHTQGVLQLVRRLRCGNRR